MDLNLTQSMDVVDEETLTPLIKTLPAVCVDDKLIGDVCKLSPKCKFI